MITQPTLGTYSSPFPVPEHQEKISEENGETEVEPLRNGVETESTDSGVTLGDSRGSMCSPTPLMQEGETSYLHFGLFFVSMLSSTESLIYLVILLNNKLSKKYLTYWSYFTPGLVQANGKKQYDRDFLLGFQFMPACVQKPEGLPPISDVVLDKVGFELYF